MNIFRTPMQPWPELAPYARVVARPGGRRLFAYDTGAAGRPAIVLVHGLGDEADTWRHVFIPLAATHRVLAPDLPGFGRSDPLDGACTLPALAGALIEWLDALGVQAAAWAGNSLGAMLAQWISLQHPRRVRRLVLADGALVARGQRPSSANLLSALPGVGEWLYTRLRRNPGAAYETLRAYYADLDALPEADRAFLYQRVNERVWSDSQRRAYLSAARRVMPWVGMHQREFASALRQSPVPTLLVWGGQDRIFPPANAQAVVDLQPGARLVVIPGAGHLPHQERPAEFVREVTAWNA